jgi:hypothetical protein
MTLKMEKESRTSTNVDPTKVDHEIHVFSDNNLTPEYNGTRPTAVHEYEVETGATPPTRNFTEVVYEAPGLNIYAMAIESEDDSSSGGSSQGRDTVGLVDSTGVYH